MSQLNTVEMYSEYVQYEKRAQIHQLSNNLIKLHAARRVIFIINNAQHSCAHACIFISFERDIKAHQITMHIIIKLGST